MKVVFFGLGSAGKRHAQILRNHFGYELFAYRSNRSEIADRKIRPVYSWKEIEAIKPDVATITNPTFLHIDTAIECAKRGMNLFIEKPFDTSVMRLNSLLRLIERRRLSSYVAYVLRFHPVINALKKYVEKFNFLHMRVVTNSYLPNWRRGTNHLKSYSAKKQMGGGVIYDLSHEIDYTQYILGNISKLQGQFEKRGNVTVDAEDYADILVATERGPANIHINFFSQIEKREITIDFKEKSIVGDVIGNSITEYKNGKPMRKVVFRGNINDCYKAQLKFFFQNIINRRMMNNAFEAGKLFKKIYRFRRDGLYYG